MRYLCYSHYHWHYLQWWMQYYVTCNKRHGVCVFKQYMFDICVHVCSDLRDVFVYILSVWASHAVCGQAAHEQCVFCFSCPYTFSILLSSLSEPVYGNLNFHFDYALETYLRLGKTVIVVSSVDYEHLLRPVVSEVTCHVCWQKASCHHGNCEINYIPLLKMPFNLAQRFYAWLLN